MPQQRIDMAGKRIGYLTVSGVDGKDPAGHPLWKCKCDCGSTTYVTGSNLRSGRVLSCGCYHKKVVTNDITGQRFGKLVVLRRNGSDCFQLALWDCKCDCGNDVTVRGIHLRSRKTTSCGCYNKQRLSEVHTGKNNPMKLQENKDKLSKIFSGKNGPGWKGGISFDPYCHKFNAAFKEKIRDKFDRRCFMCGEIEGARKHAVHHIDYAKNSICNGKEWAFVPLCHKHHGMTNYNRWHWFNLLINYWIKEEWFDGIELV